MKKGKKEYRLPKMRKVRERLVIVFWLRENPRGHFDNEIILGSEGLGKLS